jgi:hypothetical protein
MPVDAFEPVTRDGARRVELRITRVTTDVDDGASAEADALVYTLSRDAEGRLRDFPFFLDGEFYQADVDYNIAEYGADATISKITCAFSETKTEVEFLEYEAGLPKIARIKITTTANAANAESATSVSNAANAASATDVTNVATAASDYSFAAFRWYADECAELWTDAAGTPLAVLSDKRVLHHDSMGNVTYIADASSNGASTGGLEYRAFYNARGVRYWSREGRDYEFQRYSARYSDRDRAPVLRLVETTTDGLEPPLNYSYDYSFALDGGAQGLWTERRELRLTELDGYLVSVPGDVVERTVGWE